MKYIILLVSLFFFQLSWSQNFYASLTGGYQIVQQAEQPESFVIHTHHFMQLPAFWRKESLGFKSVSNVDINFGHMLNHNLGYEVSFGYLKPIDVVEDDGFAIRTLSGNFWRINPKLVLSIERGKWSFNSKLGFIWSRGNINYSQGGQEQIAINYLYYDGESFGFTGSFGVERKISDRFSLFTELRGVSQSFSPNSGLMTEYNIGNQDQFEVYDFDTYELEIEFGEETEESWWQPVDGDGSQPQKLYRRNFSLGGYGINFGVKFILWRKKKEENVTP
ncbi:MAG: hypothetical protein ACJAUD_002083 [Crocinitomicaceae bacterium]|jgi:hypothetical protein